MARDRPRSHLGDSSVLLPIQLAGEREPLVAAVTLPTVAIPGRQGQHTHFTDEPKAPSNQPKVTGPGPAEPGSQLGSNTQHGPQGATAHPRASGGSGGGEKACGARVILEDSLEEGEPRERQHTHGTGNGKCVVRRSPCLAAGVGWAAPPLTELSCRACCRAGRSRVAHQASAMRHLCVELTLHWLRARYTAFILRICTCQGGSSLCTRPSTWLRKRSVSPRTCGQSGRSGGRWAGGVAAGGPARPRAPTSCSSWLCCCSCCRAARRAASSSANGKTWQWKLAGSRAVSGAQGPGRTHGSMEDGAGSVSRVGGTPRARGGLPVSDLADLLPDLPAPVGDEEGHPRGRLTLQTGPRSACSPRPGGRTPAQAGPARACTPSPGPPAAAPSPGSWR